MMSIKEHPPQPEADNALVHVPVLLEATLDKLLPQKGDRYLDLTAGYGGHAKAFLEKTDNYVNSVLVDRDENALRSLNSLSDLGVKLMNTDFVSAAEQLTQDERTFDIILVDLGVSSPQLDSAERGFSFRKDGPLDMRMDQKQKRTAADVINSSSEDELVKFITLYGEEPLGRARRIARAITHAKPLKHTSELATLIEQTLGRGGLKQHPATRTFQALRIEVNHELKLVESLLPLLPRLLNKGGRVGIISFHSLEDRLVKTFLKENSGNEYDSVLFSPEKKPIAGTQDVYNPRSRSAKFRFAVKK